MSYLIGRMVSFKDAKGETVRYFECARGFGSKYYCDLTAATKGAATRAVNKANERSLKNDKSDKGGYFALSLEEYNGVDHKNYNPQCWTQNMLNRKAGYISISASAYGGCCDPATERYHAM